MDEVEFTLTPVDEKKKKDHVKSRAEIKSELGIRKRYRNRMSKR